MNNNDGYDEGYDHGYEEGFADGVVKGQTITPEDPDTIHIDLQTVFELPVRTER